MNKNNTIQVLRGVAIITVVAIHTFNKALPLMTQQDIEFWVYKTINSLLQYAVPCFIFISAILLGYNSQEQRENWIVFYKKKVIRVMIPYIVWSFIYVLVQMCLGYLPFKKLFSLHSWFYWLAYGKAYTHLYYLLVMIQLYLIAPILVEGIVKINKLLKQYALPLLIGGAILGQCGFYYLNKYYISQYFGASSSLVITYFFVIIMGVQLGYNWQHYLEVLGRYIRLIGFITLMVAAIYMKVNIDAIHHVPDFNMAFYQLSWYGYTSSISLLLLIISSYIASNKGKTQSILSKIGDNAFGIYLMHPFLTWILSGLLSWHYSMILFIILMVSWIFIIGITYFMTKKMRSTPIMSWLVGEKIKLSE